MQRHDCHPGSCGSPALSVRAYRRAVAERFEIGIASAPLHIPRLYRDNSPPGRFSRARLLFGLTNRQVPDDLALSASGSGALATARAWPMLISPFNSDSRTNRAARGVAQVCHVAARLVDQGEIPSCAWPWL